MTALLFVLAFAADPEPEPGAKFDAKVGADKFEAKTEKGDAVWVVTSSRGIGEGSVTLKSGTAKKVIVRFPGLRNMEMFKIAAGDRTINGKLGETVRIDVKGGRTDKASDAVLTLTIRSGKDCIEAVVESKDDPKKWTFAWINEYRRR